MGYFTEVQGYCNVKLSLIEWLLGIHLLSSVPTYTVTLKLRPRISKIGTLSSSHAKYVAGEGEKELETRSQQLTVENSTNLTEVRVEKKFEKNFPRTN